MDYAAKSGVSTEEMIQIAKNSFDVCWISDEEKAKYFAAIDEYVASFEG